MSGRELDPDGTDSYHPHHPWEQVGHELYLPPSERTRNNWPPVPAEPTGPHEAKQWRKLPKHGPQPPAWKQTYGPGFSYDGSPTPPPPPAPPHGTAGDSGARRRFWRR